MTLPGAPSPAQQLFGGPTCTGGTATTWPAHGGGDPLGNPPKAWPVPSGLHVAPRPLPFGADRGWLSLQFGETAGTQPQDSRSLSPKVLSSARPRRPSALADVGTSSGSGRTAAVDRPVERLCTRGERLTRPTRRAPSCSRTQSALRRAAEASADRAGPSGREPGRQVLGRERQPVDAEEVGHVVEEALRIERRGRRRRRRAQLPGELLEETVQPRGVAPVLEQLGSVRSASGKVSGPMPCLRM